MANGVEAEGLNTERFDITNQMESFISNNGELYACGTCKRIEIRIVVNYAQSLICLICMRL